MKAVIATAGWAIPRGDAAAFPTEGSTLTRYAQRFCGVEINSSFHRPHRAATWARWAASVPEDFRFSVKIPKTITHEAGLIDVETTTAQFARDIAPLGAKLAIALVQLPPKLAFDAARAEHFFAMLRGLIDAGIACEPRHPSWFEQDADRLLDRLRVGRVAADPARAAPAAVPGGWRGLAYWRLHGSPTIYRSAYGPEAIDAYARAIRAAETGGLRPWCVFDNTASSAATGNALALMAKL